MSDVSKCACAPSPAEPVAVLLEQLAKVNSENMATAMYIKGKLCGEENCGAEPCEAVGPRGYIGDLKRLIRDGVAVSDVLHDVATVM